MTWDFKERLAVGEMCEQSLDGYFARWYDITPATLDEQKTGIDRHFRRKKDGYLYRVEYKTDLKAGETGNAFIETVSVDTTGKPGWVHTSQADIIIYWVPGANTVYIWYASALRRKAKEWEKTYPKRKARNRTYSSEGILVPLSEFDAHAKQVMKEKLQ